MKKVILGLYAALAFALLGPAASSTAQAAVVLQADAASLNYLEFAGDGDLSAFDVVFDDVSGLVPSGTIRVSLGLVFSLADPAASPAGGLAAVDDAGLLVGGDLLSLAGAANAIRFTLGNLDGHAAAMFGSAISGVIEFDPFLAVDPFTALVDGTSYTARLRLEGEPVTAVSAPGMPWLVGAGLMALFAVRRRRSGRAARR